MKASPVSAQFINDLNAFAALVQKDTVARLHAGNLACEANIHNAQTHTHYGLKFARVDIGGSGRYMVDLLTRTIYGIKAYGVAHRGHVYGTLDTINDFNWGGYRAVRKAQA